MNSMQRFQHSNIKHKEAEQELNRQFIFKSFPSIKIIDSNKKEIQAVVVNKQEKDLAYIYTNIDNPLNLGSVWQAKKLNLLVAEEIQVIYDVKWHKYLCYLCNIKIDNLWGFFKGPEKSFVDVNVKEKSVMFSNQKAVLILPDNVLSFGDKIMIKNRAWLIQEYDNISTEGLTYYSLIPTTMSSDVIEQNIDKPVFIEKAETITATVNQKPHHIIDNQYEIGPEQEISVITENGIFKSSNSEIKILKRTENLVIFSLPFGVEETTITTIEKGEEVLKTYRMVI